MSAIIIKHEMYDPRKLDAIYQNIVSRNNIGKEQLYEIKVDDFPVVGKNSDPERFMDYNDFITPESKSLSVFLYRGNAQADKYFFHLTTDSYQKGNQLNGIEQPKPIDEKELIEKIRMEFQHGDLIKEIARLKEEIKVYEQTFERLTEECEQEKASKILNAQGWLDLGVNYFFKGDKAKAASIIDGLAGNNSETSQPETEANFKRKKEREVQDVEEEPCEFTEQDKNYIRFIEDVRYRIGDIQLANVMHLLDLMASYPQSVGYALKMVTNFINQKKADDERKNQSKT